MTIGAVCDTEVDPVAFHVRDSRRARDRARFTGAIKLIVLAPAKVPAP